MAISSGCSNIGYPSEIHFLVLMLLNLICPRHPVQLPNRLILPYPVKNFGTIWQMDNNRLGANKITKIEFKIVLDGYHTLQQPSLVIQFFMLSNHIYWSIGTTAMSCLLIFQNVYIQEWDPRHIYSYVLSRTLDGKLDVLATIGQYMPWISASCVVLFCVIICTWESTWS